MTTNGVSVLDAGQQEALAVVSERVRSWTPETTVGGLAGTGKTFWASHLPDEIGYGAAFVAYTGKAAKVLARKFRERGVPYPTSTIHRLIYVPREFHCEACPITKDVEEKEKDPTEWMLSAEPVCHRREAKCSDCGIGFEKREELPPGTRFIVVDEASMVGEGIYDDLRSYGVPIVWVGDHGQLPPVKGGLNIMARKLDAELTTNWRQLGGSPIIDLALAVRHDGFIPIQSRGQDGETVRKILGRYYGPEVRSFLPTDRAAWDDQTLVLAARNATRVGMNSRIRGTLGFNPERPEVGDRVICLRNNREKGIANGSTGTVQAIEYAKGGGKFYNAVISLDGEEVSYEGRISREQFGEEKPLEERDYDLFDYGYAMTVHKAQGSEAQRVVLLEERIRYWDPNTWKRWLYTGVTRASRELLVVAYHPNR